MGLTSFGWSNLTELTGYFAHFKPTITESIYPDLSGKIYIVTGGGTGIGYQVTSMLLKKKAKVWIVGRSQQKVEDSIKKLKEEVPDGHIEYFLLDFADLPTIKPGVAKFLKNETKLHGVFHNAGVMMPPDGSLTKQGYELQLGVNNIGPHLLQKFLDDIIIGTAKTEPENTVRVVWVSSFGHSTLGFKGGIYWDDINFHKTKAPSIVKYGQSKAINIYEGYLWPLKHPGSGVVSVSLHPGLIRSELMRDFSSVQRSVGIFMAAPAQYGAYNELFAMLDKSVTTEKNGSYIIPWGRFGNAKKDVVDAMTAPDGDKIWTYLEQQTAEYF